MINFFRCVCKIFGEYDPDVVISYEKISPIKNSW